MESVWGSAERYLHKKTPRKFYINASLFDRHNKIGGETMKKILYAILGLGMGVATPAYANDPYADERPAAGERAVPQPATKENRLEESRAGLVGLLQNTQECNSVRIGVEGVLGCSQERLIGGCGNDRLVTREIHQYDLTQAKHIKVNGQSVNLTVDGKKVSYHFQDAASAQQAGKLFRTYQENFQPPASQARFEPVGGCRY